MDIRLTQRRERHVPFHSNMLHSNMLWQFSANIAILQRTWNNYEIPTAIEPKNPFVFDIEQRAKRLFADHIALQQIDLVHPALLYGKKMVQFKQSRTNRSQLNTINTFRNWAMPPVLLLSLLQQTHQCRVLLFIVHGIQRASKGHHHRVILQRHHAALATTLRPQMNWK